MGNLHSEEILRPHPEVVRQDIGVPDQDDVHPALLDDVFNRRRFLFFVLYQYTLGIGAGHRAADASREYQGGIAGFEVGQHHVGIALEEYQVPLHSHRIGRGPYQRGKFNVSVLFQVDNPCGAHVDQVQLTGAEILPVQVVRFQPQPGQVIALLGASGTLGLHPHCQVDVRGNFTGADFQAPAFQHDVQVGRHVRHDVRVCRIRFCVVPLRQRVDKQHGMAAPEQVLVYGEQGFLRKILGMHDHQHIDVFIYVIRVRADIAHLEEFLHNVDNGPAFPDALRRVAEQRQSRHHADDALFRVGEVIDQLGDIVFQRVLPACLKKRDGGFVIRGVDADQAQVGAVTGRIDGDSVQTAGHGLVFFLRERFRFNDGKFDIATRFRGILFQQVPHPVGVIHQLREVGHGLAGHVKIQAYGFVQAGDDVDGPRRQREQFILGQVEPYTGKQVVADGNQRHRQNRRQQDART